MMTDDPDDTDDLELRRWREDGKAPAGSCPYCASRISMVERDGFFRARCSHRGCGATGPKMRSITRAADLFCCPPQRTAAGMAISARCPTCDREGCGVAAAGSFEWTSRTHLDAWRAATSDCQGHAVDWRARALAAEADKSCRVCDRVDAMTYACEPSWEKTRADAARWCKVAPLIEALHQASMIEAGDPMHVVDAAMELLAATQEPTP